MLITVAILTYNRALLLRRVIESVAAQETSGLFDYEILVVNDRSTAHSARVLRELGRSLPIRVIEGPGCGEAAARNCALAAARGEWIAFLDDDEVAVCRWLLELYTVALSSPADIVGGSRELELTDPCEVLHPRSRELLGEELWYWEPTLLKGFRYPNTGNVLIHTRVFAVIGKFDETMIYGGTDVDLMIRARRAGCAQWLAPQAKVFHITPALRLTPQHMYTYALRQGMTKADSDGKFANKWCVLLSCIARAAKLIGKDLLLVRVIGRRSPSPVVIARSCWYYRSVGSLRAAATQLLPGVF